MSEYYVLYGIDAGDDYLRLLTAEEFKLVEGALKKFSMETYDCALCEYIDKQKIDNFKNNILYLTNQLLEKRELQIVGSTAVVLDEELTDEDEEVVEVINNIVRNADFIKRLDIKIMGKFRVLTTEIYLFKLIVAE